MRTHLSSAIAVTVESQAVDTGLRVSIRPWRFRQAELYFAGLNDIYEAVVSVSTKVGVPDDDLKLISIRADIMMGLHNPSSHLRRRTTLEVYDISPFGNGPVGRALR